MPLDRKKMYGEVAQSIINLMQCGVAPWSQPWLVRGKNSPMLPRNGWSDRAYNGFNSLYLSCLMELNGWRDPRFFTRDNMKQFGGRIIKDNKGTLVVYNKRVVEVDEDSGKESVFYVMRYYKVWNAAQVLNVPERVVDEPVVFGDDYVNARALAENWMRFEGITGVYGCDRAAYKWRDDDYEVIEMPDVSQFRGKPDYFSTFFHEIIHSSGAKHRLDRLEKTGFGSDVYAKEELVAEFGSAFLCANTGVALRNDSSAAYLKGWADRCSDDPGLLVTAVNAAQRAADYVLDKSSVEVSVA